MSEKEMALRLLDCVPPAKLGYVIAYLPGLTAGEADDDAFCEQLVREYEADPDKGDVTLYPGSFLVGEVTDYNFTPYNTTIRVEEGQIVEMTRSFMP